MTSPLKGQQSVPLSALSKYVGKWPSAYTRGAGIDRMSMARCLRDIGEKSQRPFDG
jgi:hypothetical protein